MVSAIFNDNGIDKRVVIHKLNTRGLDTQWTEASLKEDVYRPIYTKVSGGKTSTENSTSEEENICVEGISKWVAQEFGVVLPPFPSRHNQE
jgi:hypothetical protein